MKVHRRLQLACDWRQGGEAALVLVRFHDERGNGGRGGWTSKVHRVAALVWDGAPGHRDEGGMTWLCH